MRSSRPDVVVTIKGDILQADYWQSIEEVGAKRITWFYDELRRMNVDEAGLQMRGPIATYSAIDAAAMAERGLDAFYLPLAFDSSLPFSPVASDAVVFVGARYGQREPMLRALYQAGVDVKAYGRAWSKHWWDRARTWSWHRPAIPSGRDLDRSHAYGVMAGARASLNLHGDQDGFTMRTFEACGVGGLQIVDRADVDSLYDPGSELLVFKSTQELVELAERAGTEPQWAQAIAQAGRKRTLAEHTFAHRVQALEARWQ